MKKKSYQEIVDDIPNTLKIKVAIEMWFKNT